MNRFNRKARKPKPGHKWHQYKDPVFKKKEINEEMITTEWCDEVLQNRPDIFLKARNLFT